MENEVKVIDTTEISFGMIIGTLAGLIIGFVVGFGIMFCVFDNDAEEKDCVEFFKKNNYITESCEIYTDKLEKSK